MPHNSIHVESAGPVADHSVQRSSHVRSPPIGAVRRNRAEKKRPRAVTAAGAQPAKTTKGSYIS